MNIKPVLCALVLAAIANVGYTEWRYPHADAANTGFVKVITAPATEMLRAATIGPLSMFSLRASDEFNVEPCAADGPHDVGDSR